MYVHYIYFTIDLMLQNYKDTDIIYFIHIIKLVKLLKKFKRDEFKRMEYFLKFEI